MKLLKGSAFPGDLCKRTLVYIYFHTLQPDSSHFSAKVRELQSKIHMERDGYADRTLVLTVYSFSANTCKLLL